MANGVGEGFNGVCVFLSERERVGEEFQVFNCNCLEREVCVTFGVL